MSSPAPITGSCLCRSLSYTIFLPSEAYPPLAYICNCTMCRKHTGAIFVPFINVKPEFIYWNDPSAKHVLQDLINKSIETTYVEYESSPGRFRGFCGKCGSTLLWRKTFPTTGSAEADTYGLDIHAGSIDEEILLGKALSSEGGGEGHNVVKRDVRSGRAKDLIVPVELCYWENCPPCFADLFGDTPRYFGGNERVTDEELENLRADWRDAAK